MPAWNTGMIAWISADGVNNVVQISTNSINTANVLYWWRNEQAGETLRQACLDFCRQFDCTAYGTNLAAFTVDEYSPDGTSILQDREFGLDDGEVFMFSGD